MTSPMHAMIDAVIHCTRCGAKAGTCACWTKCRCGWSYTTGETCGNPLHGIEDAAKQMAESVSTVVLMEVRGLYPEPMKHASGGFRRTLKAVMEREMTDALTRWMMGTEDAKR